MKEKILKYFVVPLSILAFLGIVIFSIHIYEAKKNRQLMAQIKQYSDLLSHHVASFEQQKINVTAGIILASNNYFKEITIFDEENRILFYKEKEDVHSLFEKALLAIKLVELPVVVIPLTVSDTIVGELDIQLVNRIAYLYILVLLLLIVGGVLVWLIRTGKLSFGAVNNNDQLSKNIRSDQDFYTSKMEAVEQLAAGFTHGLNNPLMILIGNVKAINKDKEVSAKVKKRATKVLESANRIQDLVALIKLFTKQSKVDEWKMVVINGFF